MNPGDFPTTHWSLLRTASEGDGATAQHAWEHLARRYWYPLYAFARRRGGSPEDVADATQSFFAHLLEKRSLAAASNERGRFRAFLLAAFKHHLSNARRTALTQKRGGLVTIVPLDLASAEDSYAHEPADPRSPERLYDRRWALLILDRGLEQLRREVVASAGAAYWSRIEHCVEGELDEAGYAGIAGDLGRSAPAIRSAVHRHRVRLGQLIHAELAQLVTNAAELEEEFRHWARVLRDA